MGDPAPPTGPLSLPAGDQYIVADCGGGTVDLTVHQIEKPQGTLKELYKASGGLQPPASHPPCPGHSLPAPGSPSLSPPCPSWGGGWGCGTTWCQQEEGRGAVMGWWGD